MKEIYISARGGNLKGYALQVYVGGLKDFIGQQYHIPLGGNTFKFDQNVFLDPETYVEITIVEEGGDDVDRKPPNWVSIDFISEIK